MRIAAIVLILAGCAASSHGPGGIGGKGGKKTTGTIVGLARDHDSGDPIALAEISLQGKKLDHVRTTSNDSGHYLLENLPPGTYTLHGMFAGQPLDVTGIEVGAGDTIHVDLIFTLGQPDPIRVDYGDPKQSQIDRYRPKNISEQVSIIEGTVNDLSTKERVPGAVVTAVLHDAPGGDPRTEQTVSDEDGRFRFDPVTPGTYAVSAYYSISGRGQIEVRRSDIAVAGAEAVVVPLWIELVR